MSNVVTTAAQFAKAAHARIDQRRKYTNAPYIRHPESVAKIVASVTDDEAIIAAAWLHDVVEDTPVTIEQIESAFGFAIAGLVADLTDVSKKSDGTRKQRKAIDRQHTAEADPRAKTIKLADLIDNLSDIANADPGFAPVYLKEKELLLEVLADGHPALFKQAQETIDKAKKLIAGRNS